MFDKRVSATGVFTPCAQRRKSEVSRRPAAASAVCETTAARPAHWQSCRARWRTMAAEMLAAKTLRLQPDPALIRLA